MKIYKGLFKDKYDERDHLIKTYLVRKALPTVCDITAKMTPVRDQGNEGSCAGFAGAAVKEYQEKIDYNKFIELSPRFLYEKAKNISGHKEGTTLRAIVKVLSKDGICEEKFWPYIPKNPGFPGEGSYINADRYRIKTYARVPNLEDLKQALVSFGPILAGIKVFKGITKVGKDGKVPTPKCGWFSVGGHAIAITGYNDINETVKFKNSWGDWGAQGYGFLEYSYIKKFMLDAYSMVDILNPNPYTIADMSEFERCTSWV